MIVTVRQENVIDTLPLFSLKLLDVAVILIVDERAVLLVPLNHTLNCHSANCIAIKRALVGQARVVYAVTSGGLLLLLVDNALLRDLLCGVALRPVPQLVRGQVLLDGEGLVAYVALVGQRVLGAGHVYQCRGMSIEMHQVVVLHHKGLATSLK